jgi:hypothetical protein
MSARVLHRPRAWALAGAIAVGASLLAGAPALAATPEEPLTEAAVQITSTGATLKGKLNPLVSGKAGWYFAYGNEGSCEGGAVTPQGGEVTGKAVKVSNAVSGLLPNSEYTFCIVARNAEGEEAFGAPLTFNTPAVVPAVHLERVSVVSASSVLLEAEVNPENQELSACVFEYGFTTAYGHTEECRQEGLEGFGDHLASGLAGGLLLNTTYHYRLLATNGTGTTEGADATFTTAGLPAVVTGEASAPTRTSAMLAGTVDPEGAATSYGFDYIDQAGYESAVARGAGNRYAGGANTSFSSLPAGRTPQAIAPVPAGELKPATTYHYALVATNIAGTTTGADRTFTTAGPPATSIAPSGEAPPPPAVLDALSVPQGPALLAAATGPPPSRPRSGPPSHGSTASQKLARALRLCRKQRRGARAACDRRARARYRTSTSRRKPKR